MVFLVGVVDCLLVGVFTFAPLAKALFVASACFCIACKLDTTVLVFFVLAVANLFKPVVKSLFVAFCRLANSLDNFCNSFTTSALILLIAFVVVTVFEAIESFNTLKLFCNFFVCEVTEFVFSLTDLFIATKCVLIFLLAC